MSGERRVFDMEFKLMSVELSRRHPAIAAQTLVHWQKSWTFHQRCYTSCVESFLQIEWQFSWQWKVNFERNGTRIDPA